jgi:hypothetical protein
MSAGAAFKIIIKIGRSFFGTNSKRVAEQLINQGGKRIPKNKLPKSANVKKAPAPKVPEVKLPLKKPNRADKLPKVTLRKDPPVGRKTTTPKKSTTPKVPAKPKVSTTAPVRSRPGDNAKLIGSGRGGSTPKVSGRSTPPNRTSAPALLRAAPLEGGPEIDKSTVKPRNTPKTKTDRKFVPKTTPKTKKTKPPLKKAPPRKTAPATGPVTNESFGKAFRRNRNAGNATFMWRGNKYTTRYKEETITQHKKKFGVEGNY